MKVTRKQEILHITAELIQTKGYSSFSYQDISDQLGITKAAIHNHFRTKEILGNAFLADYLEKTKEMHVQADLAGNSSWDKLDAYIAMMESMTILENKICPITVLQVEYNVIPESLKIGIRKIFECEKSWFIEILENGRDQGEFFFHDTPEKQALLLQAAIQGTMINARSDQHELFRNTIDQIRNTLRA